MIKKAIFPVAGLGTRFLPATKASPKELLPIVDKPLIQYAVEEAVRAGVEELIFVTSHAKRAIEDHFDTNFELETQLAEKKKTKMLAQVQAILPKGVSCVYIRQPQALGLGHAVWCAKNLISNEPFAVILADDLIFSQNQTCLEQMVNQYQQVKSSIIAVEKINKRFANQYGMVDIEPDFKQFGPCHKIIEKPKPELAPSEYGVVGRYILEPSIFEYLDQQQIGSGGEIQLTDALTASISTTSPMYAYRFEGIRFDCGSKLGYLKAILHYGRRHPEVGEQFSSYLSEFANLNEQIAQ